MPPELAGPAAVPGRDLWELCPASFVFSALPGRIASNPYAQLQQAMASDREARWILKPSDGCKGDRIIILSGESTHIAYLTPSPAPSTTRLSHVWVTHDSSHTDTAAVRDQISYYILI